MASIRTAASRKKLNLPKLNFLLDLLVFVAFLVAMDPRSSGISIHEWVSLAWGGAIIAHLVLHWDWTVAVVKRFIRATSGMNRLKLGVDLVLFLDGVLIMVSGLLMSRAVLPALGIQVQSSGVWHQLHTLSADAALILVGVHVALSWKWIVNMVKRHAVQPVVGLVTRRRVARREAEVTA